MQEYKIYSLCSDAEPGTVRYVGLTKNKLTARLMQHKANSKRLTHHAACWIRSCSKAINISLLESGLTLEEALLAEKKWISHYKELGNKLVNGNDGGVVYTNPEQVSKAKKGRKHSPETIARIKKALADRSAEEKTAHFTSISKRNKGRRLSQETKDKISKAHSGMKHKLEHNEKVRQALLGMKASEQAKLNMSLAHKGVRLSEQHKLNIGLAFFDKPNVQVIQMLEDGSVVAEWPSAMVAMRAIGVSNKHVSACINGKRKTAGGYYWKKKSAVVLDAGKTAVNLLMPL